jgi:hypothetical protein
MTEIGRDGHHLCTWVKLAVGQGRIRAYIPSSAPFSASFDGLTTLDSGRMLHDNDME